MKAIGYITVFVGLFVFARWVAYSAGVWQVEAALILGALSVLAISIIAGLSGDLD